MNAFLTKLVGRPGKVNSFLVDKNDKVSMFPTQLINGARVKNSTILISQYEGTEIPGSIAIIADEVNLN